MNLSPQKLIERLTPVAPAAAILDKITVDGTQVLMHYTDDLSEASHSELCAFIEGVEAVSIYEVGARFPEEDENGEPITNYSEADAELTQTGKF